MADIRSPDELRNWLQDKQEDWAQVIASRIAFRALPYAFFGEKDPEWLASSAIRFFWANMISWAAGNLRNHTLWHKAGENSGSLTDLAVQADGPAADAIYAFRAANMATFYMRNGGYEVRAAAADAAHAAASASRSIDNDRKGYAEHSTGVFHAIARDAAWLMRQIKRKGAAHRLTHQRLWLGPAPLNWEDVWRTGAHSLMLVDPSYNVWIEWFERRIRGRRASFDIENDQRRVEDKRVMARLTDAFEEEFWDKGASYTNATLQGWIDEARARVAEKLPSPQERQPSTIASALQRQASPEARIVDGKLDAGPNRRFDEPRYSGDLADLPSIQLAAATALRDCLPRNASAIVGRCLDGYRDELIVRGNRPIVNILKAMGSAIRAEIFDDSAFDSPDEPERWVMRDAREWDAGTGDLFRSFFRFHLILLAHFPLDPEREALIAATPIDEAAAMGPALTDPVDAVADLILALADKGFATDNIVRIIEAHRLHNRDIAQLPAAEAAAGEITPKRRHVLATLGFYLQTYSVLGSTASLAPYAGQLPEALRAAAQTLQGLIR